MLTFEVYPTVQSVPSIAVVLKSIRTVMERELTNIGIAQKVVPQLFAAKDEGVVRCDLAHPFWVAEDSFLKLGVENLHGGTTIYTRSNSEDIESLRDEMRFSKTLSDIEIDAALSTSREWSFRSFAGRTYFDELMLACAAAALATVVNGILFSDEGHWIDPEMPKKPDEFLRRYFEDSAQWHARISSEI